MQYISAILGTPLGFIWRIFALISCNADCPRKILLQKTKATTFTRCLPSRRYAPNLSLSGLNMANCFSRMELYNFATMPMQRGHVLTCSECGESTPLPRQSLLGTFEHPPCQSSGIWPIIYLFPDCGHPSEHTRDMIRLESVEVPTQNLQGGRRLASHEFERENGGMKTRVFSGISPPSPIEECFGKQARLLEEVARHARHIKTP